MVYYSFASVQSNIISLKTMFSFRPFHLSMWLRERFMIKF